MEILVNYFQTFRYMLREVVLSVFRRKAAPSATGNFRKVKLEVNLFELKALLEILEHLRVPFVCLLGF